MMLIVCVVMMCACSKMNDYHPSFKFQNYRDTEVKVVISNPDMDTIIKPHYMIVLELDIKKNSEFKVYDGDSLLFSGSMMPEVYIH